MKKSLLLLSFFITFSNILLFSQNEENESGNVEKKINWGQISGNFQSDAQYYIKDESIGAVDVPEKFLLGRLFQFCLYFR